MILLVCAAVPRAGLAHETTPAGHLELQPPSLADAFSPDAWLPVSLLLCLLVYGAGLGRRWRYGFVAGPARWRVAAFGCGWLALALAFWWPLDAYGSWSLAAHMAQHMMVIAVAPPLLLLGSPASVLLSALPVPAARAMARALHRAGRSPPASALVAPAVATLLQAAVMWVWHLPAAMQAALESDAMHYSMHLSFLAAGLLFWHAVFRSLRSPRAADAVSDARAGPADGAGAGAGAGIMALFATMMQMGLLGALLTFADTPRYAGYLDRAPLLGISALEDQQLAGLIMWVPASVPYLVGGIAIAGAWLVRQPLHGRER